MVSPYQFVMIVGRFRDSTNDPRVSRQIRLATPSVAKNVLGGQDNLPGSRRSHYRGAFAQKFPGTVIGCAINSAETKRPRPPGAASDWNQKVAVAITWRNSIRVTSFATDHYLDSHSMTLAIP